MNEPWLRLHQLRVSHRTTWEVIELRTADGAVGIGECSDSLAPHTLPEVVDEIAALLAGAGELGAARTPEELQPMEAQLVAFAETGSGPAERFARRVAISGTITALCDLAAAAAGVPLWQWLGGEKCEAVPLYANINRAPRERVPAEFARVAAAAVAEGFAMVKLAPFDGPALDGLSLAATGIAHVEAVREAVGDRVEVLVDLHTKLSPQELLGVLPDLERLRVGWIEDAVDVADLDALEWLAGRTRLPIAGGERLIDPKQIAAIVGSGHLDHLLLDPKFMGGPLRYASLINGVDDVGLSLHDPTGPVSTTTSLHLSTLRPGPALVEFPYGEPIVRSNLTSPPERLHQGSLPLPSAPGLGVRLTAGHWSSETVIRAWRS